MGVGDSIARLRRKKGWTQEELAAATGFSTGFIAAIEEERINPAVKNLAIIAKSLEVSLQKLNNQTDTQL